MHFSAPAPGCRGGAKRVAAPRDVRDGAAPPAGPGIVVLEVEVATPPRRGESRGDRGCPFAYFAMIDSGVFALLAAAVIISGPVHDMQFLPQAAFIAETFPGSRRYSGVSMGYQLASITAGGLAPIVALYLFETFGTSTAIVAFMSASALVSLAALSALRDKGGELDQH